MRPTTNDDNCRQILIPRRSIQSVWNELQIRVEYQLNERKSDEMLIAFEKLKGKFNLATIRIPYDNFSIV